MKRVLATILSVVLFGSVSYAMDDKAMEEAMEAKAPSVEVTASGEFGVMSKDDGSDGETMHLIREYKVSFSSQGTTDGGLIFGAGININDTEDDDPHQSVGGSKVYIGGADGSWKLQLGGNDPGIDVVGGIGVADDHFDGEDNKDISLSGAFGSTSYRLTMANPQATDEASKGDWSVGAKHSLGDVSVGFGMDSESGLAFSVGTELSGIGLSAYYSSSDESMASLKSSAMAFDKDPKDDMMGGVFAQHRTTPDDSTTANVNELVEREFVTGSDIVLNNEKLGAMENKGLGLKASMSAGEGAKFSLAYSKLDSEGGKTEGWAAPTGTDIAGDAATRAATNAITLTTTSEAKLLEVGFEYDLGGGATFKASVEKKDTETMYTLADAGDPVATTDSLDSIVQGRENATNDPHSFTTSTDVTTLKALVAFSF
ncbi:MAG: hypothetical protein OXG88_01205 [Gammaproteobacteria bacterium]|nr:hypothetical protein [Gammaproteobacteria bacterium]MDE2739394.1 hypothetical protein [Paracoccaceae bacterium]